jgi:acyl-[acyl-carrier-protein]-phospholipid O-acyltransferase/long-chain-fatty-acid--[acyl-carrier-protein] ligase
MLLVRGPNVMTGYLRREDLTASVMRDGWYITGDIAMLDDDGFLTITDRLSRFSKIGGEMVPHGKVEEALHQTVQSETQVFAVTGIPDDRKGEQLAVLHTIDDARIPEILGQLSSNGSRICSCPRAAISSKSMPCRSSGPARWICGP